MPIARVAAELGVRYVLEGSVRRTGDQVRIHAQLIDATNQGHLWAERYDESPGHVLKLQDAVTRKIVPALSVNLTAEEGHGDERARRINPEAHDVFLRGLAHYQGHVPRAAHLVFREDFCGQDRCLVFDEVNLAAAAKRDAEVVVYCGGPKCLLSSKSCARAVSWGFERVYYFRDGFPAWKAAGLPVALSGK